MNQDDYSQRSQNVDQIEKNSNSGVQGHSSLLNNLLLTFLVIQLFAVIVIGRVRFFSPPENSQLVITNRQPTVSTHEPTVSTAQPSVSTGQPVPSSSNRVDSEYEMSSNERTYLTDMYNQLMMFKDSESFRIYGLAQGGPHNAWLNELNAWERGTISIEASVTAGDIDMLALEYVLHGAGGSPDATYLRNQIETALNL